MYFKHFHQPGKPYLVLSPMAGYTDSAFRRLIKEVEPRTVVVTEFLSADALRYQGEKTLRMMRYDPIEQPIVVQIFGKRLENFVEAAKVIESKGVAGIDINMGCPAKKVIRADHGSALTKIENCELAYKIVEEMSKAVKIPISVKTRIGWENSDFLVPFCKRLEESGAKTVSIHGRTTAQAYKGMADWEPIYEVKRALSVPVLGNGDVVDLESYEARVQGTLPGASRTLNQQITLDGVLIGRGSFGNPWVFCEIMEGAKVVVGLPGECADEAIARVLGDLEFSVFNFQFSVGKGRQDFAWNDSDSCIRVLFVPWEEKKKVILRHCELAVEVRGEHFGMREMRKHLVTYVKGVRGAREIRAELVRVESVSEVEELLDRLEGY
jgi:tRNA-dihydrouridine synthase B